MEFTQLTKLIMLLKPKKKKKTEIELQNYIIQFSHNFELTYEKNEAKKLRNFFHRLKALLEGRIHNSHLNPPLTRRFCLPT